MGRLNEYLIKTNVHQQLIAAVFIVFFLRGLWIVENIWKKDESDPIVQRLGNGFQKMAKVMVVIMMIALLIKFIFRTI